MSLSPSGISHLLKFRLSQTDEIRSRTSKRSSSSREEEVRNAASEDLIRWVEDSGETLIRELIGSLVVSEIMLNADGGLSTSFYIYIIFFASF